jgi:hypothetical protein
MAVSQKEYDHSVFINCPFDRDYNTLFDAIVFTITDCGFRPVCARERMNSAEIRLDKIVDLIRDSRYSVHDLSRTEVDEKYSLPRFNMPLELGIALGCAKFGSARQRRKSLLILDRRQFRYQKFVSDISGQDIKEHKNKPNAAIEAVRNFLRTESGLADIPGWEYIGARYRKFKRVLPEIARVGHLNHSKLTYADYCEMIKRWLDLTFEAEMLAKRRGHRPT